MRRKNNNLACVLTACCRPNELKRTIESLKEHLNPSKIYVYFDRYFDKESFKGQNEAIVIAKNEGCIINVSEVNDGTQIAVKKALRWAFESETELFVFEDDIMATNETYEFWTANKKKLKDGLIIKFGQFYWGYAFTKATFEKLDGFDLAKQEDSFYEETKHLGLFKHALEFRMIREILKRKMSYPWDDGYDLCTKILGIELIAPENPTTIHIGKESSRLRNNEVKNMPETAFLVARNGKIL